MKHTTIAQFKSKQFYDNVFTGSLPDLVVVSLISEVDFGDGYNRNPFNFQLFNLVDLRLRRNGLEVPRQGNSPDFANNLITDSYITMQEKIGFDVGDKCVE